jgi:hypothetical protein
VSEPVGAEGWSRPDHERRVDALSYSEDFRDRFLDRDRLHNDLLAFGLAVTGFIAVWTIGVLVWP